MISLHELRAAVDESSMLYHRLVVLAGPSGQGKTRLLHALSVKLGCPLVNLNLRLAERLLELTRRQRALETARLVGEILDAVGSATIAIDNIEILFGRDLAQDPLVLLRGLSRNRTLVVAWPGTLIDGVLTYAEAGHPEFRRYSHPEGLLIRAVEVNAPAPAVQHPASG